MKQEVKVLSYNTRWYCRKFNSVNFSVFLNHEIHLLLTSISIILDIYKTWTGVETHADSNSVGWNLGVICLMSKCYRKCKVDEECWDSLYFSNYFLKICIMYILSTFVGVPRQSYQDIVLVLFLICWLKFFYFNFLVLFYSFSASYKVTVLSIALFTI